MNILEIAEWIFLACAAVSLITFFGGGILALFNKDKTVEICKTVGTYSFIVACITFLLPIIGAYVLFGVVFIIPRLLKK